MNHTPEAVVPSSVLVVDDLPDNLEILSRILVKDGCDVRAVKSGAEALNQVQIAMPDLILLDLKMPDMDGLTVCRRLKAD
ncbi:MAG: response regulator, partial [bacterium]|nr:response regulator [bacterium]